MLKRYKFNLAILPKIKRKSFIIIMSYCSQRYELPYAYFTICNCSVQMRLLPFIFIFKLSKTDEVTETIDPITMQYPPFTVFIFMPSKETHLLFFYFSPEASSTVIVEWTGSGMIAWVSIPNHFQTGWHWASYLH